MKKVFLSILIGVLSLAGVTLLLFYFGVIGNFYDSTVTKQHMDVERNNFEHSKSYVEGKLQDLANYKLQYDETKSKSDKKAILNFVNSSYGSFDIDYVNDPSLRDFLLKARGEE